WLGDKEVNVQGGGVKGGEVGRVPVQPGNSDLCFEWMGPIADAVAHLGRCGVKIEAGPMERSGARGRGTSVYFRDPDGSLMEFMSYAGMRGGGSDRGSSAARAWRKAPSKPVRPQRVEMPRHRGEYGAEHVRRKPARVGVVARAVIAAEQHQLARGIRGAVAERQLRSLLAERHDDAVVRDASQRDDRGEPR